ncbi:MAG: hypothetical protein LC637_04785 [Xanthomonadaceae bacterium]|nr:hypothetical protein [Xanthomonadaceae bacterium]
MTAVALVENPTNEDVRNAYKLAEKHFGHVPNLVKALGSNPAMCKTLTEFVVLFLDEGKVSWKFKELVILKTLRSIKSFFSYSAHEALAIELGNSVSKVGSVANSLWQLNPEYTDGERAVFELVDQVALDANAVGDEIWDKLRAHWSSAQLVELDALITTFILIGRLGDTLGIPEPVVFKRSVA